MEEKELVTNLTSAFKEVLTESFGGRPGKGGEYPPHWETQLKEIVAAEIGQASRHNLLFDLGVVNVLAAQTANAGAYARATHNGAYHDHAATTRDLGVLNIGGDRTWNPDEVAQLTETLRKGTPVQLDALAAALAAKVAEVITSGGEEKK